MDACHGCAHATIHAWCVLVSTKYAVRECVLCHVMHVHTRTCQAALSATCSAPVYLIQCFFFCLILDAQPTKLMLVNMTENSQYESVLVAAQTSVSSAEALFYGVCGCCLPLNIVVFLAQPASSL